MRHIISKLVFCLFVFTGTAITIGGVGCDTSGTENGPPSDAEPLGPLAIAWKHAYQVAGGVRLAPKPVGDSLVLFGAEARLMALRTEDGSVKWRSPRVEPSSLELKVFEIAVSNGVVFGAHVDRAKGWDLETGEEVWTIRPSTEFFELGYFGVGPESFYASAAGGRVLGVAPESGSFTLDRRYQYGAYGLTYQDGMLYFSQAWTPEGAEGQARGGIMKVDATAGDSIWSFRTERGGFYDGSPIVEDGRVYAGTHGGSAAFFAVDSETGEEVWRNEDAPTFAAPAHSPKRIYLNNSSEVIALSKETGRTVWTKKVASGSGFRGLAYHNGYVYHPRGGALFVLNAETGEIVHKEVSPSGSYWTLAAGSERIYAQSSGHLIAYEPYQPE